MVVACVQASVKAQRPTYRTHGNFNASPRLQINIMLQGVQLTRTIEVRRSYPDNHCLLFVGI